MDTTPAARLSLTGFGVIVAIGISIGNIVYGTAIMSEQVQTSRERIIAIEKEMEIARDRREQQLRQLTEIQVKLDILLRDRDDRK